MLKIVYPICCGMDVHKSFLVACIASINERALPPTKASGFAPLQETSGGVPPGWERTTARTCVWSLPGCIGSLFTTS